MSKPKVTVTTTTRTTVERVVSREELVAALRNVGLIPPAGGTHQEVYFASGDYEYGEIDLDDGLFIRVTNSSSVAEEK